jgi:hypothetical protein
MVAQLIKFCLFAFAGIQTIAALFTIWDRFQWGKAIGSDPETQKKVSTDFHLVVAAFLIIGAVVAGVFGGYLVKHPLQAPPLPPVATVPCSSNDGNTGTADAKSGQGGMSIAHSGHGDTIDANATPASKKNK